ncbi:hypothetical protein [Streptomyces sp. NPDC053048]|uniref:hypothetical protein n=1 Tax=Streptomyces sp. NPDC053048 TaxID=3365694 RepID=UPI0037CE1E94
MVAYARTGRRRSAEWSRTPVRAGGGRPGGRLRPHRQATLGRVVAYARTGGRRSAG